ncbi:MAG: hypothetical protein AAB429_00845 [Patescibacteria group bacterium]
MALISVGSVIDRAWEHYTKHFLELMSISAWLLILAILNIFSTWLSPDMALTTPGAGPLNATQVFGLVLYAVTFFLLAPVLSIWISNRLIKGVSLQLSGKTVNMKELARDGWKLFFPRLLVGFLTTLLILAPLLLLAPGGLLSLLAVASKSGGLSMAATALIFLGVIAAFLGCVYVAVRVFFSPYTLVLDNNRGRQAIKNSAALSRGRWWATLWRVAIPTAVFYFGMTTIQILILFVLKTIILQVAGLNAAFASELYNIGSGTVFIVLNTLVAPLVVTANCLIYQSLKSER